MVVYSSLCVLSSLIIGTVGAQVAPNNDQPYAHTHDYDFDDEDLYYNDILLEDEALEDASEVADEVTQWTTVQLATTVTPSQTHTEHTTVYYTPTDARVPDPSTAAASQPLPNPHRQVPVPPKNAPVKAAPAPAPVQAPARPIKAQAPLPASSTVPKTRGVMRQNKDKIFATGTLANTPTPSPHNIRQVVITRPANPPHIAKAKLPVTVTTTVMAGGPEDIEAAHAINLRRAKERAIPNPHRPVNVRAKDFKLTPVKFAADNSAQDDSTQDDSTQDDSSQDDSSQDSSQDTSAQDDSSSPATSDPNQDAIDNQYGCDTGQAIAEAVGNNGASSTGADGTLSDGSDSGSDSGSSPCSSSSTPPACPSPDPTPDCPVEDDTPDCPVEDDTPDCPVEDDTPDDCPVEDDTSDDCPVKDDTPDCPVEDDTPDCAPPPVKDTCGCGGPTMLDVGSGGCCNFEHQYGDDAMDFILDTKDHVRDRLSCAKDGTKAALSHLRPHHIHERIHQVLHDKRPEKSDQHYALHDNKGHVSRQRQYATYERHRELKQAKRDRAIKAAACDPCAGPVEEDECDPAPKLLRTRYQKPRKAVCNVCQAPAPPVRAKKDTCGCSAPPPVRAKKDTCGCSAPPPVRAKKDTCGYSAPPPAKAKKDTCGCSAPAAKAKKDLCSPPPVALPPPAKAAKKDTCPAPPQKSKKDSCNLCNPPQKAKKDTCAAPPQKAVRPKKAAKKDTCGCAPPPPPLVKDTCGCAPPPVKDTCAPPPVKDTCGCAPPPVKDTCGCGGPTMLDVGGGCNFEHQYGDDTMDFILDTKDHVRGWWGNTKLRTKQFLSHASPGHIHSRISQLLHDKRPVVSDQHLDLHDRKGRAPSRRDRGCGC